MISHRRWARELIGLRRQQTSLGRKWMYVYVYTPFFSAPSRMTFLLLLARMDLYIESARGAGSLYVDRIVSDVINESTSPISMPLINASIQHARRQWRRFA